MTDLERAREALLKLSPIQAVAALIEAARLEGAAGERARAAQWHDEQVRKLTDEKHQYWVVGYRELEGYSKLIQWHVDAVKSLRALSLSQTKREPT